MALPYPSARFNLLKSRMAEFGVPIAEPERQSRPETGVLTPHYCLSYSDSEMDAFPFLVFKGKHNVNDRMAEYLSRSAEDKLAVDRSTIRKGVDFGELYPYGVSAFSSRLKERIEGLNPKGGYFRAICDAKGRPVGLWQLWSDVVLPECLLPRIDSAYQPVADKNTAAFFYDGGYSPPLLRFDRSSVEELGDFDVAVMQERWGPFRENSDRALVVSSRFRRELLSLRIPTMGFDPVELVDRA